MDIRLTGTPSQVTAAIDALNTTFDIDSTSDWYPNRGSRRTGRVYLHATLRETPTTTPAPITDHPMNRTTRDE